LRQIDALGCRQSLQSHDMGRFLYRCR